MKYFFLIVTLTLLSVAVKTQNLIGYSSREIRDYMKRNDVGMDQEKVINNLFKYLKYTDDQGDQTLLFFLNGDSVCKSIRLVCALNLKNEKIREFDNAFRKTGASSWIDTRNGKDYLIEMRDDKWTCTFSIEQLK